MLYYLDSSALLRILLQQDNRVDIPKDASALCSSMLLEVECMRTLDRYRVLQQLSEDQLFPVYEKFRKILTSIELFELSSPILNRAASPFPTAIGTLDALHLATLLTVVEYRNTTAILLTHDEQLARAAKTYGIGVLGVLK